MAAPVAAAGVGAALAAALNKKADEPSQKQEENKMQASDIMIAGKSLSTIGSMVGSSALTKLGVAGAVVGGLYGAEQLAESMGVRGGAGFIGARPTSSGKRRKRMNVTNVKALKRADRRIDGFMKVYKKVASSVGYTTERRKATCSSKKK